MEKRVQSNDMTMEMKKNMFDALDIFMSSISSKEAGANALGITRREMKKIADSKSGGISFKNRKVIKAFGLEKEELSRKNYKQMLNKIYEMTALKEEMYQELLKLNISTTGQAYKLIKTIKGLLNDKLSWQEHVDFIKLYYPQCILAAWKEQEIILETSFYEEEKGVYQVEAEFPEWMKKVLFIDLSFSYCISSEEESGSDKWEDEIREELYFNVIQDLECIKNTNFRETENEFDSLRKNLMENLIERITAEERISWGQFEQLTFADRQEAETINTMQNVFLLGSLLLDGRIEEAMKIVETAYVSPKLYEEYGLEIFTM